jgi:hypothetical protein
MVPAISLFGLPGANYRLEYVTASVPTNAWTLLALITITNNPQLYFDVSAIGQPARFYRLVETAQSEVNLPNRPVTVSPAH